MLLRIFRAGSLLISLLTYFEVGTSKRNLEDQQHPFASNDGRGTTKNGEAPNDGATA